MTVDAMIDALVGREGRYSNHPADTGGPTMWGITEQVARAFGFKFAMQTMPRETAASIYRQRYWTAPGFDKVALRYPAVAEEMFDTGVNMGPGQAAKMLQRLLNALNREHADYPDIAADGAIGKMTLYALDLFKAKRGALGGIVLLKGLDGQQVGRYLDITEARPANEAFLFGWLANRIGALAGA